MTVLLVQRLSEGKASMQGRTGDYLSIEDVDAEHVLFPFLGAHRDDYRVDTRYTDFFGHNNTCSPDQIFRRVR